VSQSVRSVVGPMREPLVFSMRVALRQPQAAYSTGPRRAAPEGRGLRAGRAMVDGLAARFPGGLQSGSHPAIRIPEPALGYPRSHRRLPAPGAQAGTTTAPRGLKRRKDLISEMVDSGAEFVREGGSHTIFRNGRTGSLIPVPRHAEIGESLARKIVRDAKR